ncbi:SGNH/GDSL hydrolase family protein [Flavobacterium algicola]|uniref:SGNH/GDSL hydrolase family protein n=1 Tax=Flavobacterium algicola TaxID=556529 RepID=UPI001EFE06F8|nr:SGNH/GDSL hydrolase family protein [Flavobacterium algicola]MCG9793144.1 SGNH/GDSL hydrolase family protein [Flavobacterium algicola]
MKRREFVKYLGAGSVYIGVVSCGASRVFSNSYNEAACREAWKKLANKEPAFAYVTPDPKLKKVFLYGDSISIGYTNTVRKELADKANVFRIFNNGGSSDMFIPKMEQLKQTMFEPNLKGGWDFTWDVIHFNVGLHDLKYLKDEKLDVKNGKQVSSIEVYKKNLVEICNYLKKEFPKAKLIFATTTAVPDEGAEGRIAGDSEIYNQAALEVIASYPSILINDLYSFTKPHAAEWHIAPANVHYNNQGKTAQGKEVAGIIAENL